MAASSKSGSKSGRPLRGQAREIVYNVAAHLREQKTVHKLNYNVVSSTSETTGVSKSLVKRVIAEGKTSMAKGRLQFSTPDGKKTVHKKRIETDDFTKGVIRRKISEFYVMKRTVPTLNTLNRVLKLENILDCSREYLRRILKEMGFRWTRCRSSRKLLIEKPDIVAWRGRYLRQIRQYRQDGRKIVYLDETFVHSTHSVPSCWQSDTELGKLQAIGKGPRIIVVHAGGEEGFINNALLIFKSKQKTGDYHHDMNFTNFSTWVERQLLPNLSPNSVIVLDNASYHSVQENRKPTLSSLKKDIVDWLAHNNIQFEGSLTKAELLMLVKNVPSEKTYKIDKMFTNAGHSVLRLPPYHADLNPIELVWADIKRRVGESVSDSLEVKRRLCEHAFSEYSESKWKKCCEHVRKIEDEYISKDALIDDAIDSFIISVSDGSSSESESEDDSSNQFDDGEMTDEIRE